MKITTSLQPDALSGPTVATAEIKTTAYASRRWIMREARKIAGVVGVRGVWDSSGVAVGFLSLRMAQEWQTLTVEFD